MKSFKLWQNTPLMLEGDDTVPTIEYYPSSCKSTRATTIIFAGGGYARRAPHEGVGYALYLNENGMDAFVVNYRVSPYVFPVELLDARRGVRFVRRNAEKFGIDPDRVAVMGSSAGGHLAALVSTYKAEIEGEGIDEIDEISPIPNAQVLCYPVLDIEGNVRSFENLLGDNVSGCKDVTPKYLADKDTPMAFMWHCEADKVVDILNTYRYSMKLLELGVSQECHIYPRGAHGIGLVTEDRFSQHTYMRSWAKMLIDWFRLNGFYD